MNKIKQAIEVLEDLKSHCKAMRSIDEFTNYERVR